MTIWRNKSPWISSALCDHHSMLLAMFLLHFLWQNFHLVYHPYLVACISFLVVSAFTWPRTKQPKWSDSHKWLADAFTRGYLVAYCVLMGVSHTTSTHPPAFQLKLFIESAYCYLVWKSSLLLKVICQLLSSATPIRRGWVSFLIMYGNSPWVS